MADSTATTPTATTRPTELSVEEFLAAVADPARRRDCETLVQLMRAASGQPARMWGTSMVGFGSYHYRYDSGREGDMFQVGFSPRKQALTVYLMEGFERQDDLLSRLGQHRTGKACLYLERLDDVDLGVLRTLVEASIRFVRTQDRPSTT